MNFTNIIFDVIGYLGVILVVFAYWISTSKYQERFYKKWLHMINAVGAIGIGVNAFYHGATPGVVINSIWLCIALDALRAERKKKKV